MLLEEELLELVDVGLVCVLEVGELVEDDVDDELLDELDDLDELLLEQSLVASSLTVAAP